MDSDVQEGLPASVHGVLDTTQKLLKETTDLFADDDAELVAAVKNNDAAWLDDHDIPGGVRCRVACQQDSPAFLHGMGIKPVGHFAIVTGNLRLLRASDYEDESALNLLFMSAAAVAQLDVLQWVFEHFPDKKQFLTELMHYFGFQPEVYEWARDRQLVNFGMVILGLAIGKSRPRFAQWSVAEELDWIRLHGGVQQYTWGHCLATAFDKQTQQVLDWFGASGVWQRDEDSNTRGIMSYVRSVELARWARLHLQADAASWTHLGDTLLSRACLCYDDKEAGYWAYYEKIGSDRNRQRFPFCATAALTYVCKYGTLQQLQALTLEHRYTKTTWRRALGKAAAGARLDVLQWVMGALPASSQWCGSAEREAAVSGNVEMLRWLYGEGGVPCSLHPWDESFCNAVCFLVAKQRRVCKTRWVHPRLAAIFKRRTLVLCCLRNPALPVDIVQRVFDLVEL